MTVPVGIDFSGSAIPEVRFGSYSMCATLAGTPSLSCRLKSIRRYARLCPPPWCRAVTRPCTFRPPLLCSGRTSDFSGSLRVISEKSEPLAPRRPGVVGLYLRLPTYGSLTNRSAEDVNPVAVGQGDDGTLGVHSLAPAGPGAATLSLPVKRVHPGHLDSEDFLNRLLDLRLVGVGCHDEGVLALIEQAVALLRDHRAQQDVPRVVDPAHSEPLSTNALSAASVKTT